MSAVLRGSENMKISNNFIKAFDELSCLENYVPAPYLRKEFNLDFIPKNAEITITGLGFYELYINGENITKGLLAPYISNTNDIVYYDNYDISGLIKKGRNVIGIILGNGMRNAYGGFIWDFDKSDSRGAACTALCIEVKGEGKTFELEADTSFKTHASPILSNDLRMEYTYDARLEIPHWNEVGFDDSDWIFAQSERTPAGKKIIFNAEHMAVCRELKAVSIKHYDEIPFAYESTVAGAKPIENAFRKNVYVYDFGENNAGVTKLKINGKPGQVITIRHMEYLQNGLPTVNTVSFERPGAFEKYVEYAQKDVFICKGGEECFVPKFKYDGFRYAFVEGLESGQATDDALTFLVMSSDIKKRADFKCSDETLNKLQEMTQRSDISNFYYFPTDCPHREKNGWTGDVQLSAEQMLLNFDAANSLAVWLENIRAAQDENGIIPGIVPTGGWGYIHPPKGLSSGPAWDSVCVSVPYYVYKFYGDKKIISDNMQMIMRMLMYQCSAADENGLLDYGHGDWNDPFKRAKGGVFASPVVLTSSIAGFEAALRAAFLFAEIGRENEAEYARKVADDLKEAIRKNLIDFNTMTVIGECQTSQAMAMESGVFNDDEIEEAGKRLIEIIEKDGFVTTCGAVGLRYIFHALVRINEWDLAYELIVSEKRPCYGSWIRLGATTLLETFPYDNGKEVCSQNHHYMGDISSLFIQEITGIKPNPSMKNISEFEISPIFIIKLNSAEGYYDSKYGRLSCTWERYDKGIIMNISVPSGMCGNIKLRGGYKIKNGDYLLKEGKHTLQIGR